jgi:hypothetical protein
MLTLSTVAKSPGLSVRSAVARFNHNENASDQLSLWTLAEQPAWRISMLWQQLSRLNWWLR